MIRRPPRPTRTYPLFPSTTLFRSEQQRVDLLKVARSVGRVHRCTVDQQRHAAKVEAAADARSPDREPRLLAIAALREHARGKGEHVGQVDGVAGEINGGGHKKIGGAWGRGRVCKYVKISVVDVTLKNKKNI